MDLRGRFPDCCQGVGCVRFAFCVVCWHARVANVCMNEHVHTHTYTQRCMHTCIYTHVVEHIYEHYMVAHTCAKFILGLQMRSRSKQSECDVVKEHFDRMRAPSMYEHQRQTFTSMHINIHVCMLCLVVCMHVCYICMYACMYVCMYV
jgi:hypothetical protein